MTDLAGWVLVPRSQLARAESSAIGLVLGGIVSLQLGAALAKHLFATVPPTTLVWLRLGVTAVVLLVVARPRLRGRRPSDFGVALGFGAVLMGMNWCIYQAFARIPLGMAVTIEFLGPLTVALVGSRRGKDLVWVALAAAGVALFGFSPQGLNLPGVLFALAAACLWAGYIVLSQQTGRRWPGVGGLAVASVVGGVLLAPPAIVAAGSVLLQPTILLLGVGVALLSSLLPYSLELMALRTLPARVFGILQSLEPAVAALAALLLLGEFLASLQWVAVACVVVASIGASRSGRGPVQPVPD